MDEPEYRAILKRVLDSHVESAARQLEGVVRNLPPKVRAVCIEVFPDQDGEGTFSVRVVLDGPDLYGLNKAVDEWAELFSVRHTALGLEPSVPLMASNAESFQVNDAVVDCAAEWLKTVWNSLGKLDLSVPVAVIGHDDWGTITPLDLKP